MRRLITWTASTVVSGFELNCGAHELGHLVMHSRHQDEDVEAQANALAAEFLMPEHVIRPQMRAPTLGAVVAQERQDFYKRLSRRGWRKQEPGGDTLPVTLSVVPDGPGPGQPGARQSRCGTPGCFWTWGMVTVSRDLIVRMDDYDEGEVL
ncbi:ImmA/IrrE family metallo-endopeptidase [Actinomyces procaprae]|uniref:ImmA/IrrE family metallo-endopeptidase n=1 Tax=Actinomyces procaprae TaxID=2560010 RepID=UPI00109D822E